MGRLRFGGRAVGALAACCVLLGLSLWVAGQEGTPKKAESGAKKAPQSSYSDKKYTLEFREKQWKYVFEWLTDKTSLPLVTNLQPPTGTFTFIAPQGRKYTMGEIIDIINEGLLQHKYVLLRRPQAFTLAAA